MNSSITFHDPRFTLLVNVRTALHQARARLSNLSETASLEAQVLLAHVLGRSRSWVLAHPEASFSASENELFQNALDRLEAGEPLPYTLGRWEFYGLDFQVSPDVLIPRPETELLVDQALGWLNAHPGRRLAADIGAGSGCIAVSLAVHQPDLRLVASDLSLPALRVARLNALRHHVADRIDFVQADLLSPFPCSPTPQAKYSLATPLHPHDALCRRDDLYRRSPAPFFDLLCANLPYIPTETLRALDVARSEPWSALDGGADGLDRIRALLFSAPGRMAVGGALFLEIESSQGTAAQALARQAFPESKVRILQDLSGHDRLLVIQSGYSESPLF